MHILIMQGELECVVTLLEAARADAVILFQMLIQDFTIREINLARAVVAYVMAGRAFDVLLFNSGVGEVFLTTKAVKVLMLALEVLV